MKKLISIISGCYNEEENLPVYYESVRNLMDSLPQYDFECLIADNCSSDRSPQILEQIAAEDQRFKIVFNLKNYGPDRSGGNLFHRAKGDAVVNLASDLQDPPEMIPIFLQKWEEGNKLVWAQRNKTEERGSMEAVRKLYYRIIRSISESEEIERANGFGLYDREVVDWIKWADDPAPFIRNLVTALGYHPCLVPYERRARVRGKSSYNLFRYINDALGGMVASSRVPLRLATYLGFSVAVASILIGLVYLLWKLTHWYNFTAGIAPIMVGMFFLGAVQLICIGIMGEYVGEILTRVKKRPRVIERRILNFDERSLADSGNHILQGAEDVADGQRTPEERTPEPDREEGACV